MIHTRKHENGSLPDLTLPDTLYEKTTANYILGTCCLSFGLCIALMLYVNIIASEALVQENRNLISAIEEKQINEDWLLDDAKLNLKIKQLESFEGFDGKNFFTWNKSFLTGVVSTNFHLFHHFGSIQRCKS